MKKGLLIGIVAVVVIIIAVVAFVFSSLDSLIREAVEKYGSEITRAPVTLSKVDLDLTSGKGGISGLNVGNPDGFETPQAFKLGAITIDVDTGSVGSDTIIIREIVVNKPDVTYELSGSGSNIAAIQKNVDAYMAQFAGSGEKAKQDSEGPKFIIENLFVRGGTVNVSASILKGKSLSAPLPEIHLKDIGKKDGGASPGEVANKVLSAITSAASKAAGSIGVGETLDSLKNVLGGATEGATKALSGATEGASKALGGTTDAIGKGAGEIGGKLKNLFGK